MGSFCWICCATGSIACITPYQDSGASIEFIIPIPIAIGRQACSFTPGEVLLSQLTYLGAIALLAPPPLAVLCLEVVTIVQNVFEHANVLRPQRVDGLMRRVFITPDVHHIHHSEDLSDLNRNFGTIFSWWDQIFGTYLPAPAAGYASMRMGLADLAGQQGLNVFQMLILPFHKDRKS